MDMRGAVSWESWGGGAGVGNIEGAVSWGVGNIEGGSELG